jgi:cobaltochelatase CobS
MDTTSPAHATVRADANKSIVRGYADELFGLAVSEAARAKSNFPVRQNLCPEANQYVPMADRGYLFEKEHFRVLQQWFWALDGASNILLIGDAGTGKTTLIKQAAARLNWPLVWIGCHDSLAFAELIGPLILAAKMGGILLIDQVNLLSPGAAGGLNAALDEGLDLCLSGKDLFARMDDFAAGIHTSDTYYVPEAGEFIHSHPCFRIAATCSVVPTSDMTLLERFTLGFKMGYLSLEHEQEMLLARYPAIHPPILKSLCEAAADTRTSFAANKIGVAVSTRILKAIIGRVVAEGTALESQLNSVGRFLEMSMLYRVTNIDAAAIKGVVMDKLQLNLGGSLPPGFKL